jgi:hypothetical protein
VNDLSQIIPPKVLPYPIYIEIGWVHGGLGGCVYGLLMPKSRKVLQQRSMDYGDAVESKKPWALSDCSILTLHVKLCRLGLTSPRWTF